ncbi:ABC transporter permease [Faecalicatena contorta]|uniref:ABC transporter permease n=1 Tax=Faecalicatena contorta TaxID=39482 RepID=UPI001F3BF5D8|nr:ABC transporter permease [Faecalicatena contorta]MCF2667730.1 ABC transporter permease [Faecalicatena contorta]
MNWMDLLRMSSSNLKRRKLRTFLTVLGVLIGTASIVVMISLGLGMQQSLYREVEQSGGLTTIKVTGAQAGESMMYHSSDEEESTKYINDKSVAQLADLEHVAMASPVYELSVILLKGKYEGWGQLVAMTPEALKAKNIPLDEGTLPNANGGHLELVYGNGIPTMFYEKGTDQGYYETGELPDIDFAKDSLFMILDQDAYYNSQNNGSGSNGATAGTGDGSDGQQVVVQSVQKHVVKACGIVEGSPEEYNANYYNIYCDLDTLKQILKKEFSGRVIPGQPTTKSGKPYKDFCYSYAQIKVDDIENVDAVASVIREMGYNVETNAEYLDSMKSQFAIVQAVLGGIGAVSLLVAAIGIANTMMMSIYERTKEIGVIKVLGCSLKNIKQMFLLEAAFIGLIGGIAGNILSFLMSGVINFLTGHGAAMGIDGNISYIPWWLVLLSMGFAMLVGVAAGYFPALRAMNLSPLAAIRNE